MYGAVSVRTNDVYQEGWWESGVPVYYTHLFGTNGIFFQCWLTKIMCSNDVFSTTDIEHRAGYWVWPTLPQAGAFNFWHNQGLGLTSNAWNERAISDWSFATNNPVLFGNPVNTIPADTVAPTQYNAPNCTGFRCVDFKAVTEWKFNYATNKYW
jgi:hypothetical protein